MDQWVEKSKQLKLKLPKSETYQRVQLVSEWVIEEEDIQQLPNPAGAM